MTVTFTLTKAAHVRAIIILAVMLLVALRHHLTEWAPGRTQLRTE